MQQCMVWTYQSSLPQLAVPTAEDWADKEYPDVPSLQLLHED